MSWSSRFGGWAPGGWGSSRWSPFASRGDPSSTRISDSDFSYITKEDLARQDYVTRHHSPRPRSSSNLSASRPARDHDTIVFRHTSVLYPVHFPPYSIDDRDLLVGSVRSEAARALKVSDARRIRMFHKGKTLKDDSKAMRDEGFTSAASSSEILCTIGEPIRASGGHHSHVDGKADYESNDEEEYDDAEDDADDAPSTLSPSTTISSAPHGDASKKHKKRSRRKKKTTAKSPPPSEHAAHTPTVEHLPVPSGTHPTHRSSSRSRSPVSNSPRPQTPQTPQAKLAVIEDKFTSELLPLCREYIEHPPATKDKREFEHKKLSEAMLAQVLLKLDSVETEGDEDARAQRKALVKEVQSWLGKLDAVLNA